MKRKILIIEDEIGLVITLRDRLASEGYEVESAQEGNAGLALALSGGFDLLLLDLMLPGLSGFEVCRNIRARGLALPIIMLTAKGELSDRVSGLKLGADDYLVKPFEMPELLARVEALLRRVSGGATENGVDSFSFGDFRLDFRKATLYKGNEEIVLAAQEYLLLCQLIQRKGETLSRDELLDMAWGYESAPTTRTVDVHIASLRQKLGDDPTRARYIFTIRRLGYKFNP